MYIHTYTIKQYILSLSVCLSVCVGSDLPRVPSSFLIYVSYCLSNSTIFFYIAVYVPTLILVNLIVVFLLLCFTITRDASAHFRQF